MWSAGCNSANVKVKRLQPLCSTENTVVLSWDKSHWCAMVSLLWLAFSPAVRPGSLLHYLKISLLVSNLCMLPFLSELETKTVNLRPTTRWREKTPPDRSRRCEPDHPWRRWRGSTRLHRCSWWSWTDWSSLVSSTYSARWCSSVRGGNRGALFFTYSELWGIKTPELLKYDAFSQRNSCFLSHKER